MSIAINEKWRIGWDSMNWILQKKIVPKKESDEVKWKDVGYYANTDQLVLSYAHTAVFEANPDDMQGIRDVCEQVRSEMRKSSVEMDESLRNHQKETGRLFRNIETKNREIKSLEDRLQLLHELNPGMDTPESEEKFK